MNPWNVSRATWRGYLLTTCIGALTTLSGCFQSGALFSADGGTVGGEYAGCTDVTVTSPKSVLVSYDFPSNAEMVNIYRNDLQVYQAKSRNFTSWPDSGPNGNGLDTGVTYVYKCEVVIDGKSYLGKKSVSAKPELGFTFDGTTVRAENLNGTQIRLSWTPASGTGLKNYIVYPIAADGHVLDAIKSVDKAQSNTIISGLEPGKLYSYRVRAADSDSNQDGNTNDVSAFTYAGIGSVSQLSSTSVRFNFPQAGEAPAVNLYCKNTTDGGDWFSVGQIDDVSATSKDFVSTSFHSDKSYSCKAKAFLGSSEDYNTKTANFTMTTNDPFISGGGFEGCYTSAPDSLATGPTALQVRAYFPATATQINIYRNNALMPTPISDRNNPYFIDTGLTTGTTYTYRCEAQNAVGNKISGDNPAVITPSIDLGFPNGANRAYNVGCTAPDKCRVKIEWTKSTNTSLASYLIYKVSPSGAVILPALRSVAKEMSNVTLNDIAPGSYYKFRVTAQDAAGNEQVNNKNVETFVYDGIGSTVTVHDGSSATVNFPSAIDATALNIECKSKSLGAADFSAWSTFDTLSDSDVILTSRRLSGLNSGWTYTCRARPIYGSVEYYNEISEKNVTFVPVGDTGLITFDTKNPDGSENSQHSIKLLGEEAGRAFQYGPKVIIRDVQGFQVVSGPDSTATVELTVTGGVANLHGSNDGGITFVDSAKFSRDAVNGVADFSDLLLSVTKMGSYTLTAAKLSTETQEHGSRAMYVQSSIFNVKAGAASMANSTISYTGSSFPVSSISYENTVTVSIKLADQFGNPLANQTADFDVYPSDSRDVINHPTDVTLDDGTTTGTISARLAGTRLLRVTSPSNLSANSVPQVTKPISFTPLGAVRLIWIQQPSNASITSAIAPQPVLEARDENDNAVKVYRDFANNPVNDPDPNSGVTETAYFTITSFAGSYGATNPSMTSGYQADMNWTTGRATFSNLRFDKLGAYKIQASMGAVSSDESIEFTLTSTGPHHLAITKSGTLATYQKDCLGPFKVQVQDFVNNAVSSGVMRSIKIATNGASGKFYIDSGCATEITNSILPNQMAASDYQTSDSFWYKSNGSTSDPSVNEVISACNYVNGSCTGLVDGTKTLTINRLVPSRLEFSMQPQSSATASTSAILAGTENNSIVSKVKIYATISTGEVLADIPPISNSIVSVDLASGSGLSGTKSATASLGEASFDASKLLGVSTIGTYKLRATLSSITQDSNNFTVVAGVPAVPSGSNSSLTTISGTGSGTLIADGTDGQSSTISVTLTDKYANPVIGAVPRVTVMNYDGIPNTGNFRTLNQIDDVDLAAGTLDGACGTTNSSGVATCALKTTHAERKQLKITKVNYAGVTTTLNYAPALPSAMVRFMTAGVSLETAVDITTWVNASGYTRPATYFGFNPAAYDGNPEFRLEVVAKTSTSQSCTVTLSKSTNIANTPTYMGDDTWAAVTNGTISITYAADGVGLVRKVSNPIPYLDDATATPAVVGMKTQTSSFPFRVSYSSYCGVTSVRLLVKQTNATKTRIWIPMLTNSSTGPSREDYIKGFTINSTTESAAASQTNHVSTATTDPYVRSQMFRLNYSDFDLKKSSDCWAGATSPTNCFTLEVQTNYNGYSVGSTTVTTSLVDTATGTSVGSYTQAAAAGGNTGYWSNGNADIDTASLTDGHLYELRFKKSAGTSAYYVTRAGLWLTLTNLTRGHSYYRAGYGVAANYSTATPPDNTQWANDWVGVGNQWVTLDKTNFSNPRMYFEANTVAGNNDSGCSVSLSSFASIHCPKVNDTTNNPAQHKSYLYLLNFFDLGRSNDIASDVFASSTTATFAGTDVGSSGGSYSFMTAAFILMGFGQPE